MSYLVLARKYRPRNFDSMVGQDHVVRALTHALESKRLHHAYLFTGTRGIGKTTLSRILAKSLNCDTGITSRPCGVCEACTAIDADRFIDYIEMDAASNRGIADMLQLLEQAIYAPTNARFKVYMIDEVHMLTAQAFNAMLKTLEEPPEYIKFILATTDPQKIPVTVLSRCLQFNLKQMPQTHIVDHLSSILDQENIAYERPALRLLAQGARGSMRDALSLADQAISYTAGNVMLHSVQDMLGALDQTYLVRVLENLAAKDGAGLLSIVDEMASRSLSYDAALQDLGVLLHRIALAQDTPSAIPDDIPEYEDVLRLAALFTAEETQLFYQIAVHGRNELGLSPDEYVGFSMTLLRMLAFMPDTGGTVRNQVAPDDRRPVKKSETAKTEKVSRQASPNQENAGVPDDLPPWMDDEPTQKMKAAGKGAGSQQAVPPDHARKGWDGDWPTLAAALKLKGATQQLAQQTELIQVKQEDSGMFFHLRAPMGTLCTSTNVNRLSSVLTEYFGKTVKVTTEVGKVEATANQNNINKRAEKQTQAEQAVNNDPYIQALLQEFDAKIVPGSIKPI